MRESNREPQARDLEDSCLGFLVICHNFSLEPSELKVTVQPIAARLQ